MLEDTSMNGTVVDDDHLLKGALESHPAGHFSMEPSFLYSDSRKKEIKFLVAVTEEQRRLPGQIRTQHAEVLEGRGQTAQFGSMRESTYGIIGTEESTTTSLVFLGKEHCNGLQGCRRKTRATFSLPKNSTSDASSRTASWTLSSTNELKIMKQLHHPNIVQYEDLP